MPDGLKCGHIHTGKRNNKEAARQSTIFGYTHEWKFKTNESFEAKVDGGKVFLEMVLNCPQASKLMSKGAHQKKKNESMDFVQTFC
jgi:hypothetical protein